MQCTPIPQNCISRLLGISVFEENAGALAGVIIAIIFFLAALYFVSTKDELAGSILDVVKEPNLYQFLFRFVQWFLALLTFSLYASSENSDCCDGGKFLLACGILVWLYVMLLLAIMIVNSQTMCLSISESTFCVTITGALISSFVSPLIDLIFGILCVFAVCAAAFKHPDTSNAKGAIACLFFLCLSLLITSVVHYIRKCFGMSSSNSTKGREKVQSDASSSGSYNAPDVVKFDSAMGDQC